MTITPKDIINTKYYNSLTDIEREFLMNYLSSASETRLNITQSYLSAANCNANAASASGSKLLKKHRIDLTIKEVYENAGLTDEVITDTLIDIITCKHKTVTEVYDKDGNLVSRTEKSPTAKERETAVSTYFKSKGVYDMNRAKGTAASAEYKRLSNELLRSIKQNESKDQEPRPVNPVPEDTG